LHGGEMTVQSKIDEGTTVTVALPLTPQVSQSPSNIATLAPPARPALSEQALQVKKSA
jgi:two-component system, cell cycle sensor histidine kinase DivJ